MESRHAHRALSMRLNETDKNDARGLADLMRVSWFKSVLSRTLDSQYTRSMLLARKRLVDTKRQFGNQLRNIMKSSSRPATADKPELSLPLRRVFFKLRTGY